MRQLFFNRPLPSRILRVMQQGPVDFDAVGRLQRLIEAANLAGNADTGCPLGGKLKSTRSPLKRRSEHSPSCTSTPLT